MKSPGEEDSLDSARIYVAMRADGSKTIINVWMFNHSGWHGYFKEDYIVTQKYLKFNDRGRGYRLHGYLLFRTSETT